MCVCVCIMRQRKETTVVSAGLCVLFALVDTSCSNGCNVHVIDVLGHAWLKFYCIKIMERE